MPLRSIVAIPAGGSLDEALASEADAVAVTLADAAHDIAALREGARAALPRIREAGKKAFVVVNHPRTRLLRDDLGAIVSPELDAVILSHTVEPQDVRDLAVLLREFEYTRGIEPGAVAAYPVIDGARGLLRAPEIMSAAPRVGGLVFAAEAYADDVGARHEERGERLAYARGAVVAAARAYAGLPIIIAGPFELVAMSQYGFAAAILPGAKGVQAANAAFGPHPVVVQREREKVAAYESAKSQGAWVARLGTTVVDVHRARKARQVSE